MELTKRKVWFCAIKQDQILYTAIYTAHGATIQSRPMNILFKFPLRVFITSLAKKQTVVFLMTFFDIFGGNYSKHEWRKVH